MLGQNHLPLDQPSLPLQVEVGQASLSKDVASWMSTRCLWTGFGFAVLMLIGVSAYARPVFSSHASAKASSHVPAIAFNPSMPGLAPGGVRPAITGLRPVGPPRVFPGLHMSGSAGSDTWSRVVLEPDYRIAAGLAAGGTGLTLLPFVGPKAGLPLGALGAFIAARTQVVRFVFDPDALEIMSDGDDGLESSGENFAVGGANRWKYSTIEEWAMYPSPEAPILVYFRETQTKPEGQGHLFPVLAAPEKLRAIMDERVGSERRVTGAPNLQ